jgi:hypothetical protein
MKAAIFLGQTAIGLALWGEVYSALLAVPAVAAPLPTQNLATYTATSVFLFPPYQDLLGQGTSMESNADSSGRNFVYWLYQPGKPPLEVVIEQDGETILLVDRTLTQQRKLKKRGQVVGAYRAIGLPSKVFPGLIGIQQIPPELVRN